MTGMFLLCWGVSEISRQEKEALRLEQPDPVSVNRLRQMGWSPDSEYDRSVGVRVPTGEPAR